MPISRNSKQGKNESLEEFYQQSIARNERVLKKFPKESNFSIRSEKSMLRLIDFINNAFKETQVWGLTSLNRLVIQAEDNWQSDWFVIVAAGSNENYWVEYLMPNNVRPWENARVQGEAIGLEKAKEYVLIAMRESGGWKGNKELNDLLREHGL